jgi:deoxyribonuclease-1-like protein
MASRLFIIAVFIFFGCTPRETSRSPQRDLSSASSSATTSSASAVFPSTPEKPTLTIASWNMKHLGRKNQNTELAAGLLRKADLITLQEVNSSESGQEALMRLATQLRRMTPTDRICVGLSELPSGGRERYGYLWKDARVAYVKASGEVMETCPSSALTIRLEKKNASKIIREPAYGTFYSRPTKTKFVLASIHLVPSGKKPQLEVPPLFDSMKSAESPIIVAGDYNLDSGHSAFAPARTAGFRAAFIGTKTSLKSKKRELSKPYDNFWYRGVELRSATVVNLYTSLPKLAQNEIYDSISDHCPIVGEFAMNPVAPEKRMRAPSNK